MGTSTALPRPRADPWSAVSEFTRWRGWSKAPPDPGRPPAPEPTAEQEEKAERLAERLRAALSRSLCDDPEMSGLRRAALRAGENLVGVLGELQDGRSGLFTAPSGTTARQREDEFVTRFVVAVGGGGGLIGDAVARRAARSAAERLLAEAAPATAPAGDGLPVRLTGEVFCDVYRFFFGEFVGEFVRTVISESLPLAVVPFALPVDPTGLVAGAVTRQVIAVLPDPCAEAGGREPRPGLLTETAHELLNATVEHALGLREEQP
ncbi:MULTISPECIES: hypothetical protein [Micromonospora]|uniref:hypothetical protein n=1 Tax=unclassified Micromonospora TaxID=2617518 RepID=UPI001E2D0979|nr:hypothetical protein [Micromonospora sp. NBRC 110038]